MISVDKEAETGGLAKPERRSFLKLLALGGGVFAAGSILGTFRGGARNDGIVSHKEDLTRSLFRVVEKRNEIAFYNKQGEELLVVEKGS